MWQEKSAGLDQAYSAIGSDGLIDHSASPNCSVNSSEEEDRGFHILKTKHLLPGLRSSALQLLVGKLAAAGADHPQQEHPSPCKLKAKHSADHSGHTSSDQRSSGHSCLSSSPASDDPKRTSCTTSIYTEQKSSLLAMNNSATSATTAAAATPELSQVTALSNDFAEETSAPSSLNQLPLISAEHHHHTGSNNWYTSMLLGGAGSPGRQQHAAQQLAAAAGLTSSARASLLSSCDDDLGQIVQDPVSNLNWSSSASAFDTEQSPGASLHASGFNGISGSSLWGAQPAYSSCPSTEGIQSLHDNPCSVDALQDVMYSRPSLHCSETGTTHTTHTAKKMAAESLHYSNNNTTPTNHNNILWDDHQLTGSDSRCSNYGANQVDSELMINSCCNPTGGDHHHQYHHAGSGWPSSADHSLMPNINNLRIKQEYHQQDGSTIFPAPGTNASTHNWLQGFGGASDQQQVQRSHSFGSLSQHLMTQYGNKYQSTPSSDLRSLISPSLNTCDDSLGLLNNNDFGCNWGNNNLNMARSSQYNTSQLLQNASMINVSTEGNANMLSQAKGNIASSRQLGPNSLTGMRHVDIPPNLLKQEMLLRQQMFMNAHKQQDHNMQAQQITQTSEQLDVKPNVSPMMINMHRSNSAGALLQQNAADVSSNSSKRGASFDSSGEASAAYNNSNSNLKRLRADQTAGAPASGGAFKQQVRKEKVGDRITTLQQLVSPFGKTDTASVLLEAIGCIKCLQEHIQVLTSPYMKNATNASSVKEAASGSSTTTTSSGGNEAKPDLRSKGLCLVPLSCTLHAVANDINGADLYWSPAYNGSSVPR